MHFLKFGYFFNSWFAVIYTLLLIAILIFVLYVCFYYSFDYSKIKDIIRKISEKLQSSNLQSLLNGSGIHNIPKLNIITSNAAIKQISDCASGPVYIGPDGTKSDCVKICANSNASLINIDKSDSYIFESKILHPGAHCILGPPPECHTNTTHVMLSVGQNTCKPRFPNMIGGQTGTSIVACNNSRIDDPSNVLWDNKYNQIVDPFSTYINDEDELMPDGSYRFTCKFNGIDMQQNKYIENPFNRWHPLENYCAHLMYAAHPSVKPIFNENKTAFRCDCGNFEETRVKNLNPDDETSPCAPIQTYIEDDIKERKIAHFARKCFNVFSSINDVGSMFPCPQEQFLNKSARVAQINIPFTECSQALIEHPIYDKFSGGWATVENKMVIKN